MSFVDVEVTDNLGFICLNNPRKRNALSSELVHGVLEASGISKNEKSRQ